MSGTRQTARMLVYFLFAFWEADAFPHAMPDKSNPGAGAELPQVPPVVSIRFDSELEPLFSRLIVKDGAGKQVSDGNGTVANPDSRMLTTKLTEHEKGIYHVYWSVVSRDGHRSEGDYRFKVN